MGRGAGRRGGGERGGCRARGDGSSDGTDGDRHVVFPLSVLESASGGALSRRPNDVVVPTVEKDGVARHRFRLFAAAVWGNCPEGVEDFCGPGWVGPVRAPTVSRVAWVRVARPVLPRAASSWPGGVSPAPSIRSCAATPHR